MARLYPPVTEDVLSAFCLNLDSNGEKLGASINISFNLNKAVSQSEINGMALRLKTISTNTYVITEGLNENEGYAYTYNLSKGTVTFQITASNNPEALKILKVGQFYKAQLAFIDANGIIGYWSSVATIKCVAKPTVRIANYDNTDANIFVNEVLGEYIQDTSTGDSSEKVYSYRFQLWDSENNILEDTGVQLHNSSLDASSYSSIDKFTCYRELDLGAIYYIQYSVTTINGLEIVSPSYQIIVVDSIPPEEDLQMMVSIDENSKLDNLVPWEEGLVRLYIDFINAGSNKTLTGNFVILRSSSKDNFKMWQEIRRICYNNEVPSQKIFYDYTVEQGISYRYCFQQYNRYGFYSSKVYAYETDSYGNIIYTNGAPVIKDITADFEDMFLYDGKRQLKVRFNPRVNSFKNDLQEQKIDTIGGKYPFIFRNGIICYKEFPIGGLISFQIDNAQLFMINDDYNQMGLSRFVQPNKGRYRGSIQYSVYSNGIDSAIKKNIQLFKKETIFVPAPSAHENISEDIEEAVKYIPLDLNKQEDKLYALSNTVYQIVNTNLNYYDVDRSVTYNETDLTSENIMSERYFKLSVLDWLTDGKPKLFRSPTEGNYIVRLLNVSLTPKTELGRMIHEFTCTAYEIAEFDYDSLVDLGLLDTTNTVAESFQQFSINIKDILKDNSPKADGFYPINLEDKELTGIVCTHFAPGDQIRITFKDDVTPITVTIGTTGTYIYENGKPIINLEICPIDDTDNFSRNILCSTSGYSFQKFDLISSINTYTQKGIQLVGPVDNFFEKIAVGNPGYETASNLYLLEDFSAPKIQVSELLYLKIKKREIIPIYMINNGDSSSQSFQLTANNISKAKFSLTPFGNGYIKYQSIYPTDNWGYYGSLTEEERTQAMTINNLVDFVIEKCNKDIFCLFEVYCPTQEDENYENKENGKYIRWAKYLELYGNQILDNYTTDVQKFWGIYDPYLKESQDVTNPSSVTNGWWLISDYDKTHNTNWKKNKTDPPQYYFPEVNLYYDNDSIKRNLSVAKGNTIIDKNIKVPSRLSVGNGAVVELIFRVQCIDYSIENESSILKTLKNEYLEQKQKSLNNVLLYQSQQYAKKVGEIALEKYQKLLAELTDSASYIEAIDVITDRAHQLQEESLNKYYSQEINNVNNLLFQVRFIHDELDELLNTSYTEGNYVIYDNEIINQANNYSAINFETDATKKMLALSYYINNNIDTSEAPIIAKNDLNKLTNHVKNGNYNFFNSIPICINRLKTAVDSASADLTNLGEKQYIYQYINELRQQAKELFTNNISITLTAKGTNTGQNLELVIPAWQLIHKSWRGEKNTSSFPLENVPIESPQWNNYLHIEEPLRPLALIAPSDTIKEYQIANLSDYYTSNGQRNTALSSQSWIYKASLNTNGNYAIKGTKSVSLIRQIYNILTDINNALSVIPDEQSGQNISELFEELYDNKYPSEDTDINIYRNLLNFGIINANYEIPFNLLLSYIDSDTDNLNDYKSVAAYEILPDSIQSKIDQLVDIYKNAKDNEGKTIQDYYRVIKICINYKNEQETLLNTDQITLVNNIIDSYITAITNLKINTEYNSIYEEICNNSNNIRYNNGKISSVDEAAKYNINDWLTLYSQLQESEEQTSDENITKLNNYIIDFNKIINTKMSIINEFKQIVSRVLSLESSYNSDANIRTILWEEKEIYEDAYNSLVEAWETFTSSYNISQNQVLIDSYLNFLPIYLQYHYNNSSPDTATKANLYKNYIEQARQQIQTVVNEDYNRYNQAALVTEAWANFVTALAEIYKKEIKET